MIFNYIIRNVQFDLVNPLYRDMGGCPWRLVKISCGMLTHLFEGVNLNTFCLPIPRKKPLALPEFESITLFSGFVELPRKTHFQS